MTTSLRLGEDGSSGQASFCDMIGAHPLMHALYEEIRYAAPLTAPVLIEGATGTGKELVARALHSLSGRKGALITVNVAELSEQLAEAELFGVVRGAYTGSVASRPGLIMAADRGTLFLDEAGDLPPALQLKLLRVLEGGRIRQVGAEAERPVLFRLLLSVRQPAWDLMATGRWRQDFYYRVAGIALRTPRLVERRSDIPELANHFLVELGASPAPAEELADLCSHGWSGNVRELRRVVERALHQARGRPVAAEDVRRALDAETGSAPGAERRSRTRTLRDMERQHIVATLASVSGNWQAAAKALGLSRSAFYRRLEVLNIPRRSRHVFPEPGMDSRDCGNGLEHEASATSSSASEDTA
ncbi:MAG: sigma 54-interacting transcriptional regulator [Gemmatimonadales bacterium]